MDTILEMRETETEGVPIELAEDIVLGTLFKTSAEPLPEPRGCVKRNCSIHSTDARDDVCARK